VGPVRHEQLIRLLACLVVIDLSAGVVMLDARGWAASPSSSAAPTAPAAAGAGISGGADPGGVLAGGHFTHRRRSGAGSTGVTSDGASEAAAAGSGSTGGPPSAEPGSPASAGSSSASMVGSRPAGLSPASTGGGSASSAGGPASPATVPATSPTDGAPTTSTGGAASTPDTATSPPTGSPSAAGGAPAGGTGGTGGGTSPSPSGGASPTGTPTAGPGVPTVTVTDPSGDPVVDGSGKPAAVGRADIVRAMADYTARAVVLTAQVAQPVDPKQDPNWISDSTYVSWALDTNGDGVADFEVQYYLASGAPVADVSRAGDTSNTPLCSAEAGYTADGYTVAIDPACLGGPATVSFRVTTYYDTDPKNTNSDVATDVSPDGGLSRPVARPAA